MLLLLCVLLLVEASALTVSPTEIFDTDLRSTVQLNLVAETPVLFRTDLADVLSLSAGHPTNQTTVVFFSSLLSQTSPGPLQIALSNGALLATVQVLSSTQCRVFLQLAGYKAALDESTFFILSEKVLLAPTSDNSNVPTAVSVLVKSSQRDLVTTSARFSSAFVAICAAVSLLSTSLGFATSSTSIAATRAIILQDVANCNADQDSLSWGIHPLKIIKLYTHYPADWINSFSAIILNTSLLVGLFLIALAMAKIRRNVWIPGGFLSIAFGFLPLLIIPMVKVLFEIMTLATNLVVFVDVVLIFGLVVVASLKTSVFSNAVHHGSVDEGWWHQYDTNFVDRWRLLYVPYRKSLSRSLWLFEISTTMIASVFAASKDWNSLPFNVHCSVTGLGIGVLIFVESLIFVLLRPYKQRIDTVMRIVVNVAEVLVCILIALVEDRRVALIATCCLSGIIVLNAAMNPMVAFFLVQHSPTSEVTACDAVEEALLLCNSTSDAPLLVEISAPDGCSEIVLETEQREFDDFDYVDDIQPSFASDKAILGQTFPSIPEKEYRDIVLARIRRFMNFYSPTTSVEDEAKSLVDKFGGQEGAIISALRMKYGPEPSASDILQWSKPRPQATEEQPSATQASTISTELQKKKTRGSERTVEPRAVVPYRKFIIPVLFSPRNGRRCGKSDTTERDDKCTFEFEQFEELQIESCDL